MGEVTIRPITAADTIAIRNAVLRPHQTAAECHYPEDGDTTSFHFGAIDRDGRVIGIATVMQNQETRFGFNTANQLRLRGMAVLPEYQGQGIGRRILETCLREAKPKSCDVFWCNARQIAVAFYDRAGFSKLHDEAFDIPGIGPHFVMFKKL